MISRTLAPVRPGQRYRPCRRDRGTSRKAAPGVRSERDFRQHASAAVHLDDVFGSGRRAQAMPTGQFFCASACLLSQGTHEFSRPSSTSWKRPSSMSRNPTAAASSLSAAASPFSLPQRRRPCVNRVAQHLAGVLDEVRFSQPSITSSRCSVRTTASASRSAPASPRNHIAIWHNGANKQCLLAAGFTTRS